MNRTYDAAESDGIPAGTRTVFFANAMWDKDSNRYGLVSSVPEAVASPTCTTEAALREWCRKTRERYGEEPRFTLRAVERTLTLDSRGKAIPGMRKDRPLMTVEGAAMPKSDFVDVQVELGKRILKEVPLPEIGSRIPTQRTEKPKPTGWSRPARRPTDEESAEFRERWLDNESV